ncbi:hypothetical protein C8J57DRAFT_1103615 [Mycena rebaudengoi]|nr:hypothetical protein C8J57DRAFT_1103615 [Mycena rebaudengoi]
MPSSGFDAAPTIGALQIGVLFAVCLFGAVTVQVLLYYTRFTSDSWALKGMVSLVWVLDFSHTIAICNAIYTITVIQYGHPELLVFVPNSLNAAILLSGCIGPLEQGWFAFRLYKFTKTCYLPIFCVALSTCRTIGSLGLATVALGHITVFEFMEEWGWLVATLLMVGVATDLILVVGLCYYLTAWRGDGFKRMQRLVDHLMRLSIETGVITSLGAISTLVCVSVIFFHALNAIILSFV